MFHASMKFGLPEEIEALQDMVHRFAQERIAPMAAEIDRTNAFPPELWREVAVGRSRFGLRELRRRVRSDRSARL